VPEGESIQGEINALRAIQEYDLGHCEHALTCAKRALAELPDGFQNARSYALLAQSLAHQSQGEVWHGLELLHAALQAHAADAASRSLPLTGLCFLHWLEGDLSRMRSSALENLGIGEEQGLRSSVAYASYLLGILHYMRGQLEEAAEHLGRVVDLRYFASQGEYCHAAFALTLVRLAEGRNEEARATFEALFKHVHQTGSARLLALVRAFEAEMDLRLDRREQAVHWAKTASPEPFHALYMFYVPQLTLAKAWQADPRPERKEEATKLLDRVLGMPVAAHNVPLRIQALALRALVQAADDECSALETLSEALALATPGGFIQPFVDLGTPVASLLERLPPDLAKSEHVERIQAGFDAAGSQRAPLAGRMLLGNGAQALVEPLTIREQDVLDLLSERLRDKEIATKLFISPATVKSHLKTLYRKLDVGDRREAVARALELGILPGALLRTAREEGRTQGPYLGKRNCSWTRSCQSGPSSP
jgi:LuxR family maltose regulon positive regulatory protein